MNRRKGVHAPIADSPLPPRRIRLETLLARIHECDARCARSSRRFERWSGAGAARRPENAAGGGSVAMGRRRYSIQATSPAPTHWHPTPAVSYLARPPMPPSAPSPQPPVLRPIPLSSSSASRGRSSLDSCPRMPRSSSASAFRSRRSRRARRPIAPTSRRSISSGRSPRARTVDEALLTDGRPRDPRRSRASPLA